MEQEQNQHADSTAEEVIVLGYTVVDVDGHSTTTTDLDLLTRVRDGLRELP